MSITILDESMAATLARANSPQDVLGPDGVVLGQFIPASLPRVSFPEFGITDDELDRQLSDPNEKWLTPDEVVARLREIDRCSP